MENVRYNYIQSIQDSRRVVERKKITNSVEAQIRKSLIAIDMDIIALVAMAKIFEVAAERDSTLGKLAEDAETIRDAARDLEENVKKIVELRGYSHGYKPISSTFKEELDQMIEQELELREL